MLKNSQPSVPGQPKPRHSNSSLQLHLLNALSNLSMQLLDENFRPSIRILRRMLTIVKIIYRHLEKLGQFKTSVESQS